MLKSTKNWQTYVRVYIYVCIVLPGSTNAHTCFLLLQRNDKRKLHAVLAESVDLYAVLRSLVYLDQRRQRLQRHLCAVRENLLPVHISGGKSIGAA